MFYNADYIMTHCVIFYTIQITRHYDMKFVVELGLQNVVNIKLDIIENREIKKWIRVEKICKRIIDGEKWVPVLTQSFGILSICLWCSYSQTPFSDLHKILL